MHPIQKYRRAKGWTQIDLAGKVGVSMTSVQAWERGAEPRPRTLPKLADVLSVDALTLQNEIEDWKQKKHEAA